MTEPTTETTSPNFELVAQAARLAAPVSNGTARSRRVLPVPPPPPSVWTAASTPPSTPVQAPSSARDVPELRAWEEAAEQLEADWATPVDDDEDLAEHTAPLASEIAAEPSGDELKLPLIAIGEEPAKDASPSDALALVEANVAAAPAADAKDAAPEPKPEANVAADEESEDAESDLEALARSITKNSLDAAAARSLAPGRPVPKPPTPSRAPVPPPPPPLAASRPPAPPPPPAAPASRTPLPIATVTRSTPGPTPVPVATVTRTTLPPLAAPPSGRPLPPLSPAPSRPPAPSGFRASPVPPPASAAPAPGVPRAQMPTLPRMADLEREPELAAPSLLDLRRSPAARRFYAQLGVAAVFGALLATILFALIPRQTTAVSVVAAQPAEAPEAKPAPAAITRKAEEPTARDTIPPPPPVANLSVDDLARERVPAAAEPQPKPKAAAPGAPAGVVPAVGKQAPAPAPAAEPAVAAAPKPEAATPSAKGTLHITAVPPANVAIDGRPLGMTPKIVRLSPGSHRVALIGPGGRRSQTVNVAPGQTASVSVKF
jgi:hypothetical protein